MAQKLSVKIELEGAKEIAQQLESLGQTGADAFKKMGAEAEKVGGFSQLNPAVVTQKLADMGVTGVDAINQIRGAVQQAGSLEQIVQGVQQAENAFGALGKAIRPLGGELRNLQQAGAALYGVIGPIGVAGVAAFAGITAAVTAAAKATTAYADSVNKINNQAITLGKGIEQVDKFRAGLEQAGVSAESVAEILKSKLASEQGIKGLEAFIRQLEQMPDSVERSKAAVQEFGQAGAELIRILQAGSQITGFKVGGLISAEDSKKATELGQALNRLGTTISRLNTLGFAPALTTGINAATAAVEALGSRLTNIPWASLGQLIGTPFQLAASLATQAAVKMAGLGPAIGQVGIKAAEATGLFTSFGTVATQSASQADAAMRQAAGGATALGTAVQQSSGLFTSFGTAASQSASQADAAMRQAAGGATGLGTAIQGAAGKVAEFASALAGIVWGSISSAATTAWQAVVTAIQAAGTAVADFASKILTIAWDTISGLGVAAWNAVTGAIQSTINKLLEYLGLKNQAGTPIAGGAPIGGPGGGIGSNAAGGLLGGRGTGTSDSNLAWVSRGEHIMPARAVRQPGVLALLEALRRSGGDLSRVLNGMGRFALGGMVPRPMAIPAYAAGGLAGGSNVTIQFPGLPAISGLRASSDVVDQLHKAAALAQVRSGGRKPSRYS